MTNIYIYSISLVIVFNSFTNAENTDGRINVGTVLFTELDNNKDCWSTENIALLTCRMMLEDILPSKEVLLIKDGRFITDIIDYFRLVLEVVRRVTYGKVKHIMLIALTDTLGGYLNHLVVPIAKRAFYAGYIDYDNMERLYQLFDEIKCFLRTNGHGWTTAVKQFSPQMNAQPLPMLSPAPKTDPCKGLIIYEKNEGGGVGSSCPVGIPMPFFDSKTHPASIAVPFKTYSLRNMESKSASYVLVKFYMAATKCLAKRNANERSMTEFNSNFYSWIRYQVYPHLNDEKFYAAFGGILRVEETLSRLGAQQISNKEIGNYNIMPETQIKEAFEREPHQEELSKRKKSNLILMALLATIFIWFILGSMFICYRIKAAKGRNKDTCYCAKPEETKSSTSHCMSKHSKSSSKMSKLSSKLFGSSKGSACKKTSITSRTSKKTSTSSCRLSPRASGGQCTSESEDSIGTVEKSPTPSLLSKHSSTSASRSTTPSKSSRNKQLYPATCACHTSMTGKYRMTSSSEEQIKQKEKGVPLVFGYELETSSETAKEQSEDVGDYGGTSK